MNKPANHACFEVAMADMLARAYEAFPAPLDFEFKVLYDEAKQAGRIPPHCPAQFDLYHSLYGSTLAFLDREGVLHCREITPFGADGVVLTSKGFLILNKPLDGIKTEHPPTIGEQLAKAGKKAGTEALSAVVAQTVAYFVAAIGGK